MSKGMGAGVMGVRAVAWTAWGAHGAAVHGDEQNHQG